MRKGRATYVYRTCKRSQAQDLINVVWKFQIASGMVHLCDVQEQHGIYPQLMWDEESGGDL